MGLGSAGSASHSGATPAADEAADVKRGVKLYEVSNWMNGAGTFLHHASGAYLIVACATHLMPLDRRVLSMSLPLVVQHLVVLVKYDTEPHTQCART